MGSHSINERLSDGIEAAGLIKYLVLLARKQASSGCELDVGVYSTEGLHPVSLAY